MSLTARFITAGATGIAVHVGIFIRGEWHMKAPRVIAIHVLLVLITVLTELRKQGLLQSLLLNAIVIIAGYLSGLFASIVAYRLLPSHRLHHFPGPHLAPISKFWHVWQCRDSRNHELMDRLFEEYGDFVRIGTKLHLPFGAFQAIAKTFFVYYRTKRDRIIPS